MQVEKQFTMWMGGLFLDKRLAGSSRSARSRNFIPGFGTTSH